MGLDSLKKLTICGVFAVTFGIAVNGCVSLDSLESVETTEQELMVYEVRGNSDIDEVNVAIAKRNSNGWVVANTELSASGNLLVLYNRAVIGNLVLSPKNTHQSDFDTPSR